MRIKRVIRVFLAAAMTVTLATSMAGCGDSDNGGGKGKDKNGDITLTVTVNSSELGDPDLYARYEAEHPGIKIDVMPMSNNDSKLLSMIASGNPPDIIRCTGFDEVPVFVQRGILMPLDDYIAKSDKLNLDNMYEVANMCRFDGEKRGEGSLYALPKDWSPIGLWINKDVFAEAGIPLPSETEPMTWKEFGELAKKLVKWDGEAVECHGCVTALAFPTLLEMYLNGSGHSLWTDDYNSTTLTSAETKEAINYFMDLQEHAALASSLYPASDSVGSAGLLEDKIAMALAGYWFNGAFAAANKVDKASEKLMFVPAPVGDKKAAYCVDVSCIGIFSETKHPQEAYEFWEWLVSSEEAVTARAEVGLGIPASKDYFSKLPYETAFNKQTLDVVTNYQLPNVDMTTRVCPYINYSGLIALFDKYYLPVLYGRENLDDALKTINQETEILIKEGKDLVGAE